MLSVISEHIKAIYRYCNQLTVMFDHTEAEVVDGEEPSGAATGDKTVVHQTIVNQYGDHPVHVDHVKNLKL